MAAGDRLFIGLYNGWAADGVEAVLAAVHSRGERMKARQVRHVHVPLPDGLRRRIAAMASGAAGPATVTAELDRDVGLTFADAVGELMNKAGPQDNKPVAVGCSGQPVAYVPPKAGRAGAALTAGQPAIIAGRGAMPVVADFAQADLAAGGCGGPIWAWADWLLFHHRRLSRVAVNLGAMASITFIPARGAPADVVAFDAGPGAAVLDVLAHRFFSKPFDPDGTIAAHGRVCAPLLNELHGEPYFQRRGPRVACPADWGEGFVERLMAAGQKHGCGGADMLATAAELTARTVAQGVAAMTERPHEVILSGGGAMNIHLAGRIRRLLNPSGTVTVEKFGISMRAKNALCMAVLAAARLAGVSAHCPAATGAARQAVLGSVTLP